MMNCVSFLPTDVLRIVANYFLQEEDQNKGIFPFCRDWRNFMNSRKEDFSQWKKSSQLIRLKFPFAETFYRSWELQAKVFRCVENPREQVELHLNYCYDGCQVDNIVNLQLIPELKRICIFSAEVVAPCSIVDVRNIEIADCIFTNVSFSMFSNVSELSYGDFDSANGNVYDLAVLKGLKNGLFTFSNCINFNCLSDLQSLQISHCSSIVDVSCFKKIPRLKLNSCQNITDVDSLGDALELDLSDSRGIVDVSKLGNVCNLCLSACTRIVDVSALHNVHTLDISRCIQITDISGLTSVVVLNISYCRNIESVSMLVSLRDLNIRNCDKVHDLADLVHLQSLAVDGTRRFTSINFPIISKLRHLSVYAHVAVTNGWLAHIVTDPFDDFLKKIPSLVFDHDFTIVSLHSFTYLRSLTILGCANFTSLPYLPALGHLEISHCVGLQSLDIWGDDSTGVQQWPIYYFKIFLCPKIKQVSFHRKVFRCRIDHCYKLRSLEVFSQIDLLVIRHCRNSCKVINKALIVCIDFLFTGRGCRVYLNNVTSDVSLSANDSEQTWSLEDIADAAGELLPRNICRLV
jgi:hypothetical protein